MSGVFGTGLDRTVAIRACFSLTLGHRYLHSSHLLGCTTKACWGPALPTTTYLQELLQRTGGQAPLDCPATTTPPPYDLAAHSSNACKVPRVGLVYVNSDGDIHCHAVLFSHMSRPSILLHALPGINYL